MEAHGDSLMPQPGSHRRNACRPRARHGGVTLLRRAGSSAGVGVAAEIPRCRPCCVQIGYKGRFAFFRLATEPRNHAVSFRPFQSGTVLCIQFGHWVRRRGCFGHRASPLPDAQPRPNLGQTPTSLSRVAGPSAGPILCCAAGDIPRGWVRSAPGGGIRRRQGQKSGPPTREVPPPGRKRPRPCRMSPLAARRRPEVCPGPGPGCVQFRPGMCPSSGLRATRFRLGRAARPGQLAHAGSPRRAVGPAPGRCSPHAWPQHRRRPPVVRRSARSTAPAP